MEPQVDSQNPITPPQTPNHHKFIWIFVGVFILLMIALLASLKFQSSSQKEVVKTQDEIVNETDNWKTYINEEEGFEFRYPKDWNVEGSSILDKNGQKILTVSSYLRNLEYEFQSTLLKILEVGPGYNYFEDQFEKVYIKKIKDDSNILGFLSRWKTKETPKFNVLKGDFELPNSSYKDKLGTYVNVVFIVSDSHLGVEVDEKLFEKILSTFRFIDTNNYDTFDPDATLSDISANPVFKTWLKQKQVAWSVIESAGFESTTLPKDELKRDSCAGFEEYSLNHNDFKFIKSPDKKKTVCFGNGGEPDSDFYYVDNIKKTSIRVESCGTPCSFESGFWLDNDKFVFLWTMSDYEYENNMKPYYNLNIELYNFKNGDVFGWTTKHLYK